MARKWILSVVVSVGALLLVWHVALSSVTDVATGVEPGNVKAVATRLVLATVGRLAGPQLNSLRIAAGLQLLRKSAHDPVEKMSQAGAALKMFGEVANLRGSSREEVNLAHFHALSTLVRLPWDSDLESAAGLHAEALLFALNTQESDSDERAVVLEVLALHSARLGEAESAVRLAAQADGEERSKFEEQFASHIRSIRLALTLCVAGESNPFLREQSALSARMPRDAIRRAYRERWDEGLTLTVAMSDSSEACKRLAKSYTDAASNQLSSERE